MLARSSFPPSQRRSFQRFFGSWREFVEAEQKTSKEQISSISLLIKSYRKCGFHLFDPYQYCAVKPLERFTRDFLSAIFNRVDLQELGQKTFDFLLQEAGSAENGASSVSSIRQLWDGQCPECDLEVPMTHVRPDIVLSGDRYLVAIEIKRRRGVETASERKELQSVRLVRSAKEYGKTKGISESAVLVLFLTPDGLRW